MKCECRACGESFGGESAFNRHRVGEFSMTPPNYGRRCLTEQEMAGKGWFRNAAGRWSTSAWDKNYRLPICRRSTGGDRGPGAAERQGVGCSDSEWRSWAVVAAVVA